MKKIIYLNYLLISCVLVALASCHEDKEKSRNLIPDVQVIPVGQQTVPIYSEYIGQTFGDKDVQLQARVQGRVTGIYFKDGQRVKKGSLLYTLDDLSLKTAIDGGKADMAKSIIAMTNKKSDLDRIQPLADMNALSQSDLDAARAAYEAAQTDVKISEARLRDIQIQLGYTHITAPMDGTIGISNVRVGDYIGGAGSGILNTISSLSKIKVRFPVPENDYLRITKRMDTDKVFHHQIIEIPVDLLLSDGSVYPEKGKLDMANRQVDANTGSLLMEALFTNSQMLLKPGQYVKVKVKTDVLTNAIIVPQQAINQMQDIFQVYLLNDSNKIVPQKVKLGPKTGSNVIVLEGLKPGANLVLAGSAFLNPKVPVEPIKVNWNYKTGKAN
jgi:membrane fusion protein (multidrug efflux system)